MKRFLLIGLAIVLCLGLAACSQTAGTETSAESKPSENATVASNATGDEETTETTALKDVTIGYVVAGAAYYYQVAADTFSKAAEDAGWKVTQVNSEYNAEKEISNVQDLITKQVDGIVVVSANVDSSQTACQMANEANIPIIVVSGAPAEGEGVPTCSIQGNWYRGGELQAQMVSEINPDAKVAIIDGVVGVDVTTGIDTGFSDKLAELCPNAEIVSQLAGDWDREKAMSIMQDIISSQQKVDVVLVHNEDMAIGVAKVIADAGKTNEIYVLSFNGMPEGLDLIKDGGMYATIQYAPTKEGYLSYLVMKNILEGKTVAGEIENPELVIKADNVDDACPWDVDEFYSNYLGKVWDAEEYLSDYVE